MPTLSDSEEELAFLPLHSPPQNHTLPGQQRRRQPLAMPDPVVREAFLPPDDHDHGKRAVPMHWKDSKYDKLIPPVRRPTSAWSQVVRRRVHDQHCV
jgi:hypothetical protein